MASLSTFQSSDPGGGGDFASLLTTINCFSLPCPGSGDEPPLVPVSGTSFGFWFSNLFKFWTRSGANHDMTVTDGEPYLSTRSARTDPSPSRLALAHATGNAMMCNAGDWHANAMICDASDRHANAMMCDASDRHANAMMCDATDQDANAMMCDATDRDANAMMCDVNDRHANAIMCDASDRHANAMMCDANDRHANAMMCDGCGGERKVATAVAAGLRPARSGGTQWGARMSHLRTVPFLCPHT
jgi:hypothetical protein